MTRASTVHSAIKFYPTEDLYGITGRPRTTIAAISSLLVKSANALYNSVNSNKRKEEVPYSSIYVIAHDTVLSSYSRTESMHTRLKLAHWRSKNSLRLSSGYRRESTLNYIQNTSKSKQCSLHHRERRDLHSKNPDQMGLEGKLTRATKCVS